MVIFTGQRYPVTGILRQFLRWLPESRLRVVPSSLVFIDKAAFPQLPVQRQTDDMKPFGQVHTVAGPATASLAHLLWMR